VIRDTKFIAALFIEVFKRKKKIYELYNKEGERVGIHMPLINGELLEAMAEANPALHAYMDGSRDLSMVAQFIQMDMIELASIQFGANEDQLEYAKTRRQSINKGTDWIEVPWATGVVLSEALKPPFFGIDWAAQAVGAFFALLLGGGMAVLFELSDYDPPLFAAILSLVLMALGVIGLVVLIKNLVSESRRAARYRRKGLAEEKGGAARAEKAAGQWFAEGFKSGFPQDPDFLDLDEVPTQSLEVWCQSIGANPKEMHGTIYQIKNLARPVDALRKSLMDHRDVGSSNLAEIFGKYLCAVCPNCLHSLTGEQLGAMAAGKSAGRFIPPKNEPEIKRILGGQCARCDSDKYVFVWLGDAR
jgi:hypothetical protein